MCGACIRARLFGKCPINVLPDERTRCWASLFEGANDVWMSGRIAERDREIALPLLETDPAQRHTARFLKEGRLAPFEQSDKIGCIQTVFWQKVVFAGAGGIPIPRTHKLAIVAPEHAVADCAAKLDRDRRLVLDGEIRDAAIGVELTRCGDGTSWTDRHAGFAFAAQIAAACPNLRINRQGKISEDFAKEEPRTGLFMEEQGVLTDPAQT